MGVKAQDIRRRIREPNSCLVFTLTGAQMAGMHCSNLSVNLNSVTERGLIIPTVNGAWSLFMLCFWQQRAFGGAWLEMTPAVSALRGCSSQCEPRRPWECHLKWPCDFPMNVGASPEDAQELSWAAGRENSEPPWLTPLHHFHHMQTLETHTHTHIQNSEKSNIQ